VLIIGEAREWEVVEYAADTNFATEALKGGFRGLNSNLLSGFRQCFHQLI
jgi:hypothetical protein